MTYLYDPTESLTELSLRIKGEAYLECLGVLVIILIVIYLVRKI